MKARLPDHVRREGRERASTFRELSEQLQAGRVTPSEATRRFVERARALNPRYNALIKITSERAAAQAEQLDKLAPESRALLGMPIAIKDVFDVKGIETTNGGIGESVRMPRRTAQVVANVEKAGAVVVGKANLDEYGLGATSENPHYGAVHNPWNRTLIAGGSSGGSAVAVAAGIVLAALGTDTGGSVRIPAALCGVVGLKPTFGALSTEGVTPTAWTQDHVGILASRVEDVASVFAAAGNSTAPEAAQRSLQIGVPLTYFSERVEQDVARLYRTALVNLERLGHRLVPLKVPVDDRIIEMGATLALAEAHFLHRKRLVRARGEYGAPAIRLLERGASVTIADYLDASRRRIAFREALDRSFNLVDVLATPTTPISARTIGQATVRIGGATQPIAEMLTWFTSPFNLSGHPALSIPCGLTTADTPVGLQLVTRRGGETVLLGLGYTYQQAFLGSYLRHLDRLGGAR